MELPSRQPFAQLLESAKKDSAQIVIRDLATGVQATRLQLLASVVECRDKLRKILNEKTVSKLDNGSEDVFIALLVEPGWGFVVAMLAIRALGVGGAVCPLSPSVLPEEAKYFLELSKADVLLYSSKLATTGKAIEKASKESDVGHLANVQFVNVEPVLEIEVPSAESFTLIESQTLPERAELLLFTSGTTGRPKGVVHSHKGFTTSFTHVKQLPEGRNVAPLRNPIHWAGGYYHLSMSLISGACIEFCHAVFTPAWFFERARKCDIASFAGPPELYSKILLYYQENIEKWPIEMRKEIVYGVASITSLLCGGAPLPLQTAKKWSEAFGGSGLRSIFGATEFFLTFGGGSSDPEKHHTIGSPLPGVQVKISSEEELLIKAPWQFSRYVSKDPEVMKGVFDSEGFFRTGDRVRKDGDDYEILGRLNIDAIRFAGYKMLTQEIEDAILSLPFTSTAMVLGVEDISCHQRVAAIISVKAPWHFCALSTNSPNSNEESNTADGKHHRSVDFNSPCSITLADLRTALATLTTLQKYKFPTLVYWLDSPEELPMTSSGKISKVLAKRKFFGEVNEHSSRLEKWNLEGFGVNGRDLMAEGKDHGGKGEEGKDEGKKAWDWAGIGS